MNEDLGEIMRGLKLDPARMRANLEATGGLFFSQRLLLALVESGLDRDTTRIFLAGTRRVGPLADPCIAHIFCAL